MGARTYLISSSTLDKAGNRRTWGADNAREGPEAPLAVVRVLGVDAGYGRELRRLERRTARDRDGCDLMTLQTFRTGGEDTRTHSDTIMHGVPVDQPVTIPWSARHRRATLNTLSAPGPPASTS